MGDLDFSVTREMLEEHFNTFVSNVKNANVILDNVTKRSKGYGFVTLESESDYRRAIEEVNGTALKGR